MEEAAVPGPYSLRDCEYVRKSSTLVLTRDVGDRRREGGTDAVHDYADHIWATRRRTTRAACCSPCRPRKTADLLEGSAGAEHPRHPALRDVFRPVKSRSGFRTRSPQAIPGHTQDHRREQRARPASWPSPRIFLDEVDGYPASAGKEGDPISLVRQRSRPGAFRRKLIIGSTPTIEARASLSAST